MPPLSAPFALTQKLILNPRPSCGTKFGPTFSNTSTNSQSHIYSWPRLIRTTIVTNAPRMVVTIAFPPASRPPWLALAQGASLFPPFSTPISLPTLDDGTRFGSWASPLSCLPSNIIWSSNWALRDTLAGDCTEGMKVCQKAGCMRRSRHE